MKETILYSLLSRAEPGRIKGSFKSLSTCVYFSNLNSLIKIMTLSLRFIFPLIGKIRKQAHLFIFFQLFQFILNLLPQ